MAVSDICSRTQRHGGLEHPVALDRVGKVALLSPLSRAVMRSLYRKQVLGLLTPQIPHGPTQPPYYRNQCGLQLEQSGCQLRYTHNPSTIGWSATLTNQFPLVTPLPQLAHLCGRIYMFHKPKPRTFGKYLLSWIDAAALAFCMFTYVVPGLLKVWCVLQEECSQDNQWQKLPYRCPHYTPSTRRIATPMRPGSKQKSHDSSCACR